MQITHIDEILKKMVEMKASDLHIKADSVPFFRVDGFYVDSGFNKLTKDEVRALIGQMTTDEQKAKFDEEFELDLAHSIKDVGRFRVNVYLQSGELATVIRFIPVKVSTIDELGLPEVFKYLASLPRGLVLVTGPTGSGKSTTLAAMIDYINSNRKCHIVTIEDPVEFIHKDKESVIDQREIGKDTHSFANALKRVLRQDPDVILVGEMRDLETVSTALTGAETGHLVLATLHTNSAPQTIDRIIDVFPSSQQPQVRSQLCLVLEGVICQTLIPKRDGIGRVPAFEIMVATPAIRTMIRENQLAQISSAIQTGKEKGMQTLDSALKELIEKDIISFEAALSKVNNPENFKKFIRS